MNHMNTIKKKDPRTWIPSLYFAMGLPFVVLSMVSVLMFDDLGISKEQIGLFTSAIMLPWTLKFLWSPLLEMAKTKKQIVILTQIVSGICFALLALSLPLNHFFAISIALMGVVALSGATHDIVADGVYLEELSSSEQAKYIGWQGASYNLAKILTSGALVYLAGWLKDSMGALTAWMIIMALYACIMICIGLYHHFVLPGTANKVTIGKQKSSKEVFALIKEVVVTFFQKKHVVFYLVFILLYRLAEGLAIKMVPLFLKDSVANGGLGLSVQDIGLVYGSFGAAAFLLGSLLAGYYIAKSNLKRTLFSLCLSFNIPFIVYFILAIYQPESLWLVGGGIVLEYFGYGFGFVGLMLFMMQEVARGKHKMAHYAFATGIMNLGYMIPGMLSGYLCGWLGYTLFFAIVMVAAIPALIATKFVPFHKELPIEGEEVNS